MKHMKEVVRGFLGRHRRLTGTVMAFMVAMTMSISCFAVEPTLPTFDLTAIATDCATKIVTDLLGMIAGVAPVLITLVGASIGIAYAISFIKKITKKAG